jgi:hypothetical protein
VLGKQDHQLLKEKLHQLNGLSLDSSSQHDEIFMAILQMIVPKFRSWDANLTYENNFIFQNLMPFIDPIFSVDKRLNHVWTHGTVPSSCSSVSRSKTAATTGDVQPSSGLKRRFSSKGAVLPDYISTYISNP